MKRTVGSPNPASACVERQDAGRPQRERDADRDEPDRHPARDEQDDGDREDREDDRSLIRSWRRTAPGAAQSSTGYPGPSGMPSTNQGMNSRIQTTATMTAYGSIRAMIVPMPASGW